MNNSSARFPRIPRLPFSSLALACALLSASTLSGQMIRIQTVISKFVDKDHSELIAMPSITVIGSQPAKIATSGLELVVTAASDDTKAITVHSRLTEKTPDGKVRFTEDIPPVTIPNGQKATVRAGDFQIEFSPRIAQLSDRALRFPGGTLSEFLAYLTKAAFRFELMAEKADLETEIPALTMNNSNADLLVTVLNKFLNPRGLAILPTRGIVSAVSAPYPIYTLQKFVDPDADKPPGTARFRSYPLSDYLVEKQTVEEITQALQSAWELFPGSKAEDLRMKFHPGTSLLLVTGPQDAINTVETVLGSLRSKAREVALADETRRLEMVKAEVVRRRAARMANPTSPTPETDDAERNDRVAEKVRALRTARDAAKPTPPPATSSNPTLDTAPTDTPAAPSSPKPALDPALEKKRLETVNAEVERRRAAREAMRAEKSATPAAPAASAPPATPATTTPPPEPEKQ